MGEGKMHEAQRQEWLARVTPERVRQLVLELEPHQPEASRNTVPVYTVIERLVPELKEENAPRRVQVEMLLRRAILDAIRDVPDLEFVETDG